MRLVLLWAVCSMACVRPADSADAEQARQGGQARTAQAKPSGPAGEIVRFKRLAEPREGAFTILAPADWSASGGIVRVNPLNSGGALNSLAPQL